MIKNILAKRGLPLGIQELKACSGSYSQFGEVSILSSLFSREGKTCFYLDLGCYHPCNWSNTYHFYRRGWQGLAIDASGLYQQAWKQLRPRDLHQVAAVVPSSMHKVTEFVETTGHSATSYCSVSTEDGSEINKNRKELKIFAIEQLDIWYPFNEPPSLISTDLEGLDLDVWMSFPFHKIKPRAIVLELHNHADKPKLLDRLVSFDYKLYGMTGPSLIFYNSEIAC